MNSDQFDRGLEQIKKAFVAFAEARKDLTIGEFEDVIRADLRLLGGRDFVASIAKALTAASGDAAMPISTEQRDFDKANAIFQAAGLPNLVPIIANAIAAERERCAQIAEAIDSGRGNEKEIAHAIRQQE